MWFGIVDWPDNKDSNINLQNFATLNKWQIIVAASATIYIEKPRML